MKFFDSRFLIVFLITACLIIFSKSDRNFTMSVNDSDKEYDYKISEPNSVSVLHVGPERKAIWPLIWYTSKDSLEVAKREIPNYLKGHCITEQITKNFLKQFLTLVREKQVQSTNKPFGTSEIRFFEKGIITEVYTVKKKELYEIMENIRSEIDTKSYFRIYLTRIFGIQ